MPLSRWNDDRLDDLARQVQELAGVQAELAQMRERLGSVNDDTHSCITELRDLKAQLDRRAQTQHEERKSDRRWMIGTLLTTAGLVIAALAVFVG